jgi:hypothetical protein
MRHHGRATAASIGSAIAAASTRRVDASASSVGSGGTGAGDPHAERHHAAR